jgi:hypothetical protein
MLGIAALISSRRRAIVVIDLRHGARLRLAQDCCSTRPCACLTGSGRLASSLPLPTQTLAVVYGQANGGIKDGSGIVHQGHRGQVIRAAVSGCRQAARRNDSALTQNYVGWTRGEQSHIMSCNKQSTVDATTAHHLPSHGVLPSITLQRGQACVWVLLSKQHRCIIYHLLIVDTAHAYLQVEGRVRPIARSTAVATS